MVSAFRQSNGIIQGQLLNDKIDQTQSNVLAELSEIEKITVKPHIVPTWADPFIDGQDGDAAAFAALSNHPEVPGVKLNTKGKPCYYTKIRGSNPIPIFVGSVEGLEDIDFDSLQEIEDQEGPNGEKVYAVDGTSHIRAYGDWHVRYNDHGNRIQCKDGEAWLEIVCFSNALITKGYTNDSYLNTTSVQIDGNDVPFTDRIGTTTNSPLTGRFSDPVSLLNELKYTNGLRSITFYSPEQVAGWMNQCYGVRIGLDHNKETIFPQKCIAQGKVFQVGYGEEESLPDVWVENYGQPGYNGEYDDFQDWGIGESVMHAVTDHLSDASQFMSQPLNIYEWIVNTSEGNAYRLLNPFLVSGIHQANTGSHCNWSDPKPYTNLPATGNDVVAGQLYYSSTYSKLYKCIVGGTLNYVNQNDIEASGLFAREIPINGGITAWVTYDGIISPTNRARVTRWIKKKARHIGNTDIDERANGQQRPVFESGEVDFSKHELMQVLHWRQFGNGDCNGVFTNDFSTLDTTQGDRAYVLDDGLCSMVASSAGRNSNGLYVTEGNAAINTFMCSGLSIYGGGEDYKQTRLFCDLLGTNVIQFHRVANNYDISINNVKVGTLDTKNTAYLGELEFYLYQIKLPDLPDDSCVISKKTLMAKAISPTEAGNLVVGKGVRRCHATKDVFYDQSNTTGNWIISNTLYPDMIGGFEVHSGNSVKDVWSKYVFSGNGISVRLWDYSSTVDTAILKIDGLVATSTNFPQLVVNCLSGTFDYQTGIWTFAKTDIPNSGINIYGLIDSVHVLECISTTAVGTWLRFNSFDSFPKIHRYNHYKTTHHPFVQPEFLGGGDGIDCDDLIVSPDGEKTLNGLKRPNGIEIIPGWSLGLNSGHCDGSEKIKYNYIRGKESTFNAEVRDCIYPPSSGKILIKKAGFYSVSVNNLTASGVGAGSAYLSLRLNGASIASSYAYPENRTGEYTSLHCARFVYLNKGDEISVDFSAPKIYGTTAIHANFNGLLINNKNTIF